MLAVHLSDTKDALTAWVPYLTASGAVLLLGLIMIVGFRKLSEERKLLIRAHKAAAIVLTLAAAAAVWVIMIPVGRAMVSREAVSESVPVIETEVDAGEEETRSPGVDLMIEDAAYTTVTEGQDWGPAITKVILNPGVALDGESVSPEKFAVSSVRTISTVDYAAYKVSEPSPHEAERSVTAAYLSDETGAPEADGSFLTLELEIAPYLDAGSPFSYNFSTGMNEYIEIGHTVATTQNLLSADGKSVALAVPAENNAGNVTLLADEFDVTGRHTYTSEDGKREINLTYASWFPQQEAEAETTPLIIWLHGMGEGGTDPRIAILGNKVVNLITKEVQENFGATGAAVLAPQTPTMWLDTDGNAHMAMGTANSESYYTEALMSLITDFVEEHPEIDSGRLYIGGCSNGGYMTVNMLIHYPGVFAAAYPVCEPYQNNWLTEEKLSALVDTPIWMTASKSDTVVTIYKGYREKEYPFLYRVTTDENGEEVPLYEYSNALYDRLVMAGAKDVHYSLFDTVSDTTGLYKNGSGEPYEYDGHWSWIYTLNNECHEVIDGKEMSIFEWMAAHTIE